MRNIEYRGKRVSDQKWVYGHLGYKYEGLDAYYVIGENVGETARVIPETIGQFTGKLDAMKNKIFEGDRLGKWPHGDSYVYWDEEHACFACKATEDEDDPHDDYGLLTNVMSDCDFTLLVIGNMYEKREKLCPNCGTPAEKRYDHYWCKLCHNEF